MARLAGPETLHLVVEPTIKERLSPGDFVPLVAKRSGLPDVIVRLVIRHYLNEMSDQLAAGKEVILENVGTVYRHWLPMGGSHEARLQLRFRWSERLRKALQLYG